VNTINKSYAINDKECRMHDDGAGKLQLVNVRMQKIRIIILQKFFSLETRVIRFFYSELQRVEGI